MVIKDVLFSDIAATLGKFYENDEFMEDDEVIKDEQLGDDEIIACGVAWRVPDKNLIFVEGTYCNYNEETGECEPDWSLTLIYENVPDKDFDVRRYLYFEQDCPGVAIANFLRGIVAAV